MGARYPKRLMVYEDDRGLELLRAIAERWETTQAEAVRRLIRNAAREMGLPEREELPGAPVSDAVRRAEASPTPDLAPAIPAGDGEGPLIDLRELAERVRTGDREAEAELRRLAERMRAETTILPAELPGPPSPEWRAEFRQLLEEVRAGVPEEWSEEELRQHVEEAVAAVRAERRARRR